MEHNTSTEIEERDSEFDPLLSTEDQQENVTSSDSTTKQPTTTSDMTYPEKNKIAHEDHGFDEFINLLLLSLLLLFFAAEVSTALSQFLIEESGKIIASVSSIFSLSLGIIACVALLEQLLEGKVTPKPVVVVENEKRLNALLRDSLSLALLVVCCPFVCILQIGQLFFEISCQILLQNNGTQQLMNGTNCQENEEVSNTVFSLTTAFRVLFMLFMGLELLLFLKFRRLRFSKEVSKVRSVIVKSSLMVLVAVDLGMLFSTVIQAATDNYELNQQANNSKHDSTSNDSSSAYLLGRLKEAVKQLLYPYTVEFCILSVEFVVSHMILNHDSHQGTEQKHSSPPAVVPGSLANEAGDVTTTSTAENTRSRRCMNLIVGWMIHIFLILLPVAFPLITLKYISVNGAMGHLSVDCLQFEIWSWIVLTLLVVVGTVCAIKCKFAKRRGLHGFDYLVIISVFGPILSIVGTIILTAQGTGSKLPIAPKILNLLQILLQTPFLFYLDNVDCSPPSHKKLVGMILKTTILYLAWCNFALGLTDSVMPRVDCFEVSNADNRWLFLQEICRPLAVFYRFSSFLLLWRALRRWKMIQVHV